ncbi:MAG: DAK2 domain-containing protein [Clostridia bacterium]|nr:DAK2 domain-containing protein [Clostridia bacterium]
MSRKLSASLYLALVRGGAAALNERKSEINDLNVFPIPDGDTGDNMYMTISAGTGSTENENEPLCAAADRAAGGMLVGARGNSGVILSRIFKGIAKGFTGAIEADAADIMRAAEAAVSEAYGAVATPVEGTILTVLREGVAYANSSFKEGSDAASWLDDFIKGAEISLEHTPELLPVLAEAGVIDSGGAGLICIARGMRDVLDGKEISETVADASPSGRPVDLSLFTEDSELTFGYCTEFLLRLQRSKTDIENFDVAALTEWLNSVGDSVVAFRDGSIVKVHVHTFDPGTVLTYCRKYGEFLTLKIENMTLQHHESELKKQSKKEPIFKKAKKYGFVAVADGEGIVDMFKKLGVDVVIEGGQCNNPSAGDFVAAYEQTDAEHIIVLPNNGNVVLAAQQSAGLFGGDVRVIPTKSLGEGYLAMSAADVSARDADELVSYMTEAAESSVTCTVSKASRDAVFGQVVVKTGDYVGISGKSVLFDSPSRTEAVIGTAGAAGAAERGVIMLIAGKGVPGDEAEKLASDVSSRFPDIEVISIDGGQSVYEYITVLI